jgi:thiamine-monophosphate kinase
LLPLLFMESSTQPLTPVSEIGEFGLIEKLRRIIPAIHDTTLKGVGDDAAVLKYPSGQRVVVSTDAYVEGVHFDLVYTPLLHLGYKCIAGSISDICAMNATPGQVTISLALSSKFTVEAVEELYKGMAAACESYNIDLVGGDTTSSRSGLVINVTAIGYAEEDKIVYRSGAREGDLICVTGDLGGAYIGLQLLEREKRVFTESPGMQPDLAGNEYVLQRQLRPEARKDIIELFESLDIIPTSMIDISDGLASETLHLCTQSGTGCRLFEEKIPLDQQTYDTALKFNIDPTLCALSGGEDYELLFTIHAKDYPKVQNLPDFTVIGVMEEKALGSNLVTRAGAMHALQAQGWKQF